MNEITPQLTYKDKPDNIFRNKNFILLFSGKLVSKLGDSIYLFALTWYVLEKYSSPVQAGIIMMLGLIPVIFVGPFAGVVADRLDRKKIIVGMDIARGVVVFLVVFLLQIGMLNLWLLYVSTFVLSLFGALFNPACTAVIPNIVGEEQLTGANSADTAIGSLSNILGVLCGGIAYTLLGFNAICIINAASFIISGFVEMFLDLPLKTDIPIEKPVGVKSERLKGYIKELMDGFTILRSVKGLHMLFVFFMLLNFLVAPVCFIYLPYIFNKILMAEPSSLAYVQAVFGIGIFAGAVLVSIFGTKIKKSNKIILMGIWCSNITILGFAFPIFPGGRAIFTMQRSILAYIILTAVMGIASSFISIPVSVLFQKLIPDEYRGRVNALMNTIITAALPLGYLVGGFVAEFIQMYMVLGSTFIFLTVIAVFMSFTKSLKEL